MDRWRSGVDGCMVDMCRKRVYARTVWAVIHRDVPLSWLGGAAGLVPGPPSPRQRLVYHPNSPPSPPFAVGVEERNGSVAVHVRGEVDMATTPELRMRLEEIVKRRRPAVVDLEEVSFIDGRGVATLVECAQSAAAAGCPLCIAHPSLAVRRLVQIMGLEGELIFE